MNSGVYMILNVATNMYYIGSAFNFDKRFKNHKIELQYNRHCNPYLQNAWNKYGADKFDFIILEPAHKSVLIKHEQFWLDYSKCYDRTIGYNICKIAGNKAGVKTSPETLALLSSIRKGKKRSEEFKEKIRQSWKTRVVSDEAKKNMSLAHIGEKHSEKFKSEMSERMKGNQFNKGRKHSTEHVEKRVSSNRGKKRSLEARARMSEAQKQRGPISVETRQRMSILRSNRHSGAVDKSG